MPSDSDGPAPRPRTVNEPRAAPSTNVRWRNLRIRPMLLGTFLLLVTGTIVLLGFGTWMLVRQFLWDVGTTALDRHVHESWTEAVSPARTPRLSAGRLHGPFEVVRNLLHPFGEPREETHSDGEVTLEAPTDISREGARLAHEVSSPFNYPVRVLDRDGTTVGIEGPLQLAPPSADVMQRLGRTRQPEFVVYLAAQDDARWQVLVYPVTRDGRVQGYLQVGAPWKMSEDILQALAVYAGGVGLAVALVGCLIAVLLARTLSAPLERLARAAHKVREGDLATTSGLPAGRTEVLAVAAEFDQMVRRLDSVFTAQKRFVADASHELKTPLTSIHSVAELLDMGADDGDPAKRARAVSGILREADRMQALLESLLALSRAEYQTKPMALDMASLCEQAVQQQRERDVPQRMSVDCDADVVAWGDAGHVAVVLRNLLDNAIKYSADDGVIAVQCRRQPQRVEVTVTDTGRGIAASHLPHVFERFYRADTSRDRKTGGSGLGLSIVHTLVTTMGGGVSATSQEGKGTAVTFWLPAAVGTGEAAG